MNWASLLHRVLPFSREKKINAKKLSYLPLWNQSMMTQNNILTKKISEFVTQDDNIHFSILSVIIVALVNKKPLNIFLFVFFIPGPEEEPLKVA